VQERTQKEREEEMERKHKLLKSICTLSKIGVCLLALPTKGKDIVVFRFIIEYSSFRDFGPLGNNRSIFI
jgi:hypothetical protein